MVKDTAVIAARPELAGEWSRGLRVEVGGRGMIAQAGVVLPRLLADRIGLTAGLRAVLARRGFTPGRDRGRLLAGTAAALIVGASCVSDVEGLTRQSDLYGPSGGASDSTVLRALSELAVRIGADGLPDARLAGMLAQVRAQAWAQIIAARPDRRLPVVHVAGRPLTRPTTAGSGPLPVTVLRVDATIIESATLKPGVAGHFKGGIGFHPLTVWCSNTGDPLAIMQRPGNAGSSTGADHVKVLRHA